MEINYYIGGLEVEQPLNSAEFGIELNNDKGDVSNQAISLTEFEFGLGSQTVGNDAASLINLHRSNGLSSGVGVFEGLPYKIELTHEGNTDILFDGYLNTSNALFDCDKVVVQAVERGGIDFLNETADSVTFAYLYEKTTLKTDFRFIPVPYVLNSIPDTKEAAIATISLTFVTVTISTQIEELIELLTDVANPIITVNAAIKIALRIAYIIGLIITFINLVKQIVDLLIQPVKYHDGMTVKNLCEIGAAHFGMTFESSILNNSDYADKLIIIPKKYAQDVNNTLVGDAINQIIGNILPISTTSRGYYQGTFGQLLRDLKEVINGKIIIEGTVLKLEREDYNNSSYNYILPPVDQTQYNLNASELKSNYTVEFLTDINDKTTLINYDGTITQAITRPIKTRTINTDMVLMTGLESRNIPFARGNRKTSLTNIERILGNLLLKIDNTIDRYTDKVDEALTLISSSNTSLSVGFPSLYDLLIGDRIGMLLMENDIIDVPKLVIIDENITIPSNTNINANNEAIINTDFLYKNYHYLRNFATTGNYAGNNQHKLYSAANVPFCYDDYQLLKNSNRLQDSEGRSGELITCSWNVENQTADFEYKINESYTNNISLEIITPNGK